jgi:hypothetical protein
LKSFTYVLFSLLIFIVACSNRDDTKEKKLKVLELITIYENIRMNYVESTKEANPEELKKYKLKQTELLNTVLNLHNKYEWYAYEDLKNKLAINLQKDTALTNKLIKSKENLSLLPVEIRNEITYTVDISPVLRTDEDMKKIIDETRVQVYSDYTND